MSEARRYTFGTRGLGLLFDLFKSHESQGYACTVEREEYKGFVLFTLVVVSPKREPVKFTPARKN